MLFGENPLSEVFEGGEKVAVRDLILKNYRLRV